MNFGALLTPGGRIHHASHRHRGKREWRRRNQYWCLHGDLQNIATALIVLAVALAMVGVPMGMALL